MTTDLNDVTFQLQTWGYATTGDILETSATVAEARNGDAWQPDVWDRTRRDIQYTVIKVGDRAHLAPEWFCLRWLPTHLQEVAVADLHARWLRGRASL